MTRPLICLVGNRQGALDAAAAVADVLMLSPKPPRRTIGDVRHLAWDPCEGPESHSRVLSTMRDCRTPAAVVPLGERGVRLAAALSEGLRVPGPSSDAARLCTDKFLMKQAVRAAGVPCARALAGHDYRGPDSAAATLGLPMVIKQRIGSGGRGFRVARSVHELPDRLQPEDLAETWVNGTEMSVESLVRDSEPVWTNMTEYVERQWVNVLPYRPDPETRDAVLAMNRRAIRALGVTRGMTHLECFLTADGPLFGELAWRPPGGYLMPLIRQCYGFDPWATLFRLWLEPEHRPAPPAEPRVLGGVRVLHPGPGRVRAISGLAVARAVPGVSRVTIRLKPGERVGARRGAGQDAGCIQAAGPDRGSVLAALDSAHAALSVAMDPD